MLLPRVLTAVVGIPLVLWLVHVGSLPFLVLVLSITALSLYEYGLILEIGRMPVRRWVVVGAGLLVALGLAVGKPRMGPDSNGIAAMALTLGIAAAVLLELVSPQKSLDRPAMTVFGIMLVGWTLPHLYLLRDLRPYGEGLTWLLLVCVWATDTAAYFVGHAIGKTPLSPISPKKTWEGAVGGLAASVLVALAMRSWLLKEALGPVEAALAGAGIGIFGQLSDLSESLVKRAAGVKESGYLLPGHGGMLDRFDSFLLAGPFMYYMSALKWM